MGGVSCRSVLVLIFASFALISVFCDDFSSSEGLINAKPSTGTESNSVEESLSKPTEASDEHFFSAQAPNMMNLLVNYVYSEKEVFLRELISNAADAVEKIRLQSITDPEALKALPDLAIMIKSNLTEKTISVRDTGIGMTKKELFEYLGTIAKSGTSELQTSAPYQNTSDFIGQFGVGFYSVFSVADYITVVSKHNDDIQYIWESDSKTFKVSEDPRGNTLGRGTEVIIHLKDEATEYLQNDSIRKIVKKHSQFATCPIKLWESRTETVEEEDKEEVKADAPDDVSVEEEKPKEKKTVEKTVWGWVQLNDQKPLWTKKASEVADEDYKELFKFLSHSTEAPLAHIHFSAEGDVNFNAVLFVSPTPRPDLFHSDKPITDNVKLYVRRVFVMENVDELLPRYLGFVYGIVDSDNLPLDMSREKLQQHRLLKLIKKKLVRKVLEMLQKMPKEDYEKFWKRYAVALKLGMLQDISNKAKLTKLLRFYTSKSENELTSFDEYLSRIKEDQEEIYFVTGQSIGEVKNSLFVERILRLGYEVIYFTEPMDEYVMQTLTELEGKKTRNLAKGGLNLKLDKESKEKFEDQERIFKPLTDWLKDKGLPGKIKEAKVSQRLHSSPCALVADEYMASGNFQKVILSQAYGSIDPATNSYYLNQKQTLEVNPRHPLIKKLNELVQNDPNDTVAKECTMLLYDTAVLRSGFIMQDLNSFAERIERELRKNLDVDLEEQVEPDDAVPESIEDDTKEEPSDAESVDVKEEL